MKLIEHFILHLINIIEHLFYVSEAIQENKVYDFMGSAL